MADRFQAEVLELLSRLRFLLLAIGNAPTAKYVLPSLLLAWMAGLFFVPRPQDALVQWLSLVAVCAGFVAGAGGILDSLSLRRKYPPLVLVGGGVCVLLSAISLLIEPSGMVAYRISPPLLVTGGMWFYVFYFSVVPARQRTSRLRIGERFPDFTLPDSEARTVTLASMLAGGPALMVFYKGDW